MLVATCIQYILPDIGHSPFHWSAPPLSSGAIVGLTSGVMVTLLCCIGVLVFAIVYFWKRKQRNTWLVAYVKVPKSQWTNQGLFNTTVWVAMDFHVSQQFINNNISIYRTIIMHLFFSMCTLQLSSCSAKDGVSLTLYYSKRKVYEIIYCTSKTNLSFQSLFWQIVGLYYNSWLL